MSEKYNFVGAKIPKKMKEEIAQAVEQGGFLNESDLLRQAIRSILDKFNEVE